ncbi:MAG TPA: hypothetical protein VN722_09980 [Hanamia sp.]|nr:hypothetical protein [Hanamia sp.]
MDTATNYAADFYSATDNNIDMLKKNIEDFPVSSVARFLLLYHHKINNHPDFEILAKQTSPYLNNPFWIEYQLFQSENSEQNNAEEVSDPQNNVEEVSLTDRERELPFEKKEELISEFKNEAEEALPVNEVLQEIPEKFEEKNEELISAKNTDEELPVIVNEEIIPISIPENKNPDEDNSPNSSQEKNEITNPEIISVNEEKNNDSLIEINADQIVEERSVDQIKIPDVQESNSPEEETNSPVFSEENEEESIPFEPLHTVDYFASQGIKISEEALNDHLGKQVKSFTAWLKSMKKLHPGKLPEQNEVIERLIQASSEVSNQNANVLTEAMAEVLVKQGKQEKAIEMYQKLSLLNPSKSAYFAAKIESLKTI